MKKVGFLLALIFVSAMAIVVACDDDDDDDNDDATGSTLCYVQCENGCISPGACLSGISDADSCETWGAEHCGADGCDAIQTAFVEGCDICTECPDIPDWYDFE